MSTHETLGLLLVRDGVITRTQLYDALRLQRQDNRLLGTCLLTLGYIQPESLLEMLSRQLQIPALPPGALRRAQKLALQRVPAELAYKLRVLPYSWDGEMLGVAVSDGRILEHLQEIAYHARCAVGAYVALEPEIDEALRLYYPQSSQPIDVQALGGRPRPPRAQVQTSEPAEAPTVLSTVKRPGAPPTPAMGVPALDAKGQPLARSPTPAQGVSVINRAPPPATADLTLERMKFLDAVEQIYDQKTPPAIAKVCGRALLNYFSRVAVAVHAGGAYRLVGCAGTAVRRVDVPEGALPLVKKRLDERNISYGPASLDVRAAELCGVFGITPGATAMIASVGVALPERLVLFADNGDSRELYEELHDIEMLCKEAETALGMLKDNKPT